MSTLKDQAEAMVVCLHQGIAAVSEAHDLYASFGVKAGVAESAARLALLAERSGDPHRGRE